MAEGIAADSLIGRDKIPVADIYEHFFQDNSPISMQPIGQSFAHMEQEMHLSISEISGKRFVYFPCFLIRLNSIQDNGQLCAQTPQLTQFS
jgi:hypothetical protein